MWESIIKYYRNSHPVYVGCKDIFDAALKEQDLEYKDGKIVELATKEG